MVLGCAGDVPTLECAAASAILREHLPELRVRLVNVVDLMRLQPAGEHPHGLSDGEFDALFTRTQPVIFAYHGYPWLIHRLTYRRTNHENIHVRGYKEEGTTTTPFDMVMLNDLDRFHLVIDVIDRVPGSRRARRARAPADGRRTAAPSRLHARARRRPARCDRLALARRGRAGAGAAELLVARARPRRQRRLEQPQADAARRRGHDAAARASSPRRGPRSIHGSCARRSTRRSREADAVGHRIVHGGERFRDAVEVDAGVRARAGRARRPRAAASAEVARCARRGQRARCRAAARRCLLRHRLPRDAAAGRGNLRAARRVARALGAAPLRLPRALARLGRAARAGAARARRAPRCGSSAAIWARAPRCARSPRGARWRRRWASRRWRAS